MRKLVFDRNKRYKEVTILVPPPVDGSIRPMKAYLVKIWMR